MFASAAALFGIASALHSTPPRLTAATAAGFAIPQSDAKMDFEIADSTIPNPESLLGYKIGDRITTYRDQEAVLETLMAKSKGKMARIEYGKSTLGLPLRVYAISTAQNIARLEEIRKANEAIALGKKKPGSEPAIVWINECIHGNEPASFESAMMLAYNLVAGSNGAAKSLKDVVVILNPVYNPDGHERFAVFYNSVARGSAESYSYEFSEPGVIAGRLNQYRFDMNRDRVSCSQAETQQEIKLFQKWRPHVYADQHGQVENYFMPPNPMAMNANVDRNRVNKWTDIFGREIGGDFDRIGWSYFIRSDFDLYYIGYLDTFTTLCGAIGMTHETDGGKQLNKTRSDGSIVSLREGAAKHLVSALALVKSASKNRSELLASWAKFKVDSLSGAHAKEYKRFVITGEPADVQRFKANLDRAGVTSSILSREYTVSGINQWTGSAEPKRFEPGSLVVEMAQENGALAKALLEANSDFEPEFIKSQQNKKNTAPDGENYPGQEGTEFYDTTAWALPFCHSLQAWAVNDASAIATQATARLPESVVPDLGDNPGYLLRYKSEEDVLAVHDLAAKGVRIHVTNRELRLSGKTYAPGTFVIFRARNDANLRDLLKEAAGNRGVSFEVLKTSYPDGDDGRFGPGASNMAAIPAPKVGVFFGSGANLSFGIGGIWFTLDKSLRVPFTALNSSNPPRDLSDYSVLVAPAGSGVANNSRVKEWVSAGGTLVILSDFGAAAAVGLSANGIETRSLPGAFFKAKIDPRSPLSFGYPVGTPIAFPLSGSTFYKPKKSGGSVVTIVEKDSLLSGWSWGEESIKAVSGAVAVHDEPTGAGHIVYFVEDPCDRAMYPGLHKLLLNAMFVLGAR